MESTSGASHPHFNPDAVHAKYRDERDKRLTPGRAAIRNLVEDNLFGKYREDPFTPFTRRDPIAEEIDVAVVGAGIAGTVVGANLRQAGIERIRLIDQAGGIGGTWYWNRYPGVMCDVESYIYMPMLEDLDYIPTRKYAFGDEIREHLVRIAEKYELVERCPVSHWRPNLRMGRRTRPAGSSAPIAGTRSGRAMWSWPWASST